MQKHRQTPNLDALIAEHYNLVEAGFAYVPSEYIELSPPTPGELLDSNHSEGYRVTDEQRTDFDWLLKDILILDYGLHWN